MKFSIKEAETKITLALDAALADGYAIVSDHWGSSKTKRCCAIGALALSLFPNEVDPEKGFGPLIGRLLDAFEDEEHPGSQNFWSLIRGFNPFGEETGKDINNLWFQLGDKFRKNYHPKKDMLTPQ